MRSSRKPRGTPAGETGEVAASLPPVPAADEPDAQSSLESTEEPDEILVRFPTDEVVAEPEADVPPESESSMPMEASAEIQAGAAEATAQDQLDPGPAHLEGAVGEQAEAAPQDSVTTESPPESAPEVPPELLEALAESPSARPLPYEPTKPDPAEETSLQIRLARIRLRTGSLSMARAELESLAGRDLLDPPGLLDLAEARWRTGDLQGAGTVAVAYLAANGGEALGFVIAAEAASLGGRHAEARRHMEQAHLRTLTSLDSFFAGIPRRAPFDAVGWGAVGMPETSAAAEPPDVRAAAVAQTEPAAEPIQSTAAPIEPAVAPAPDAPPTESTPEPGASLAELTAEPAAMPAATEEETVAPVIAVEPEPAPREPVQPTEPAPTEPAPTEAAGEAAAAAAQLAAATIEPAAATIEPAPAETAPEPAGSPGLAEADTEIAEGIARLGEGDALLAALHFGLALRMTPGSAPVVLAALGDRRDLALELVRGDALRLLGQESDAGQAYSSVASALSAARSANQPAVEGTAGPPAMQQAGEPSDSPERPTETAPSGAPPESPAREDRAPEPPPPITWSD